LDRMVGLAKGHPVLLSVIFKPNCVEPSLPIRRAFFEKLKRWVMDQIEAAKVQRRLDISCQRRADCRHKVLFGYFLDRIEISGLLPKPDRKINIFAQQIRERQV